MIKLPLYSDGIIVVDSNGDRIFQWCSNVGETFKEGMLRYLNGMSEYRVGLVWKLCDNNVLVIDDIPSLIVEDRYIQWILEK